MDALTETEEQRARQTERQEQSKVRKKICSTGLCARTERSGTEREIPASHPKTFIPLKKALYGRAKGLTRPPSRKREGERARERESETEMGDGRKHTSKIKIV